MPVLGETTYGGATKLGTKKYGETVYGSSSETAKYGYTPSDNIQYFYDSDSRLTQIDFGTNQLSIKYEYDDAGRLTRITDVNGVQTQFEYTDRDQLYKAKTGNSTATYTYDDAGRNTRMVYPNGIYRDNTFNDRSLITQIKYTKSTSTLLKFDYEYDKIGNITRKKITWKSGKITDWHYQYDNLNRLKTVTLTKNNRTTKTYYMYDKVGNRLMKDVRSTMVSMPDITPYEYNADNELLSAGDTDFEFDLNGNMVSKKEQDGDETQYVYNKMGKMIKLIKPDGSTTKYYYRHDGLRYKKIEGDGDEILYYWGAGSIPPLLSERKLTSGSSTVSKLASYPPGIPCMKLLGKQSGTFYYLTDHLGSVYYVVDAKANIINSYDYDEFGVVTSKSEGKYLGSKLYNTKGFTGEPQHQEEDGMVYLRQRYYNPETGRFITRDRFLVPNFVYCLNNPVIYIDPIGYDVIYILYASGRERYDSNQLNKVIKAGKGGHTVVEMDLNSAEDISVALEKADYVIIKGEGHLYQNGNDTYSFAILYSGVTLRQLIKAIITANDTEKRKAKHLIADFCHSGDINEYVKERFNQKMLGLTYWGITIEAKATLAPLDAVKQLIEGKSEDDVKSYAQNINGMPYRTITQIISEE